MQNNTITINDFSEVSEYLYDEYLEYVKRIKIKFINENLDLFLETIIQNEQIELLKYILDNCKSYKILISNIKHFLANYKGKNHPEKILKILFEKIPNLKSYLLNDQYFIRNEYFFKIILTNTSLEFVKQIYKLIKETNIPIYTFQIYDMYLYYFYDKSVFYWLLDIKVINYTVSDLKNWLIIELGSDSSNINKDNINYLLEKINLDKSELYKFFTINTCTIDSDQYLLDSLLVQEKYDLIYYFFELLKPKEIIHVDKIREIFKHLVIYTNYEMFMFITQHIILLKYDNFLNDIQFITECFEYCNKFTDERIGYELIKLGAKLDKNSIYNYKFNNIQIIKRK